MFSNLTGRLADWIRDKDQIVPPFYETLHGNEIN